jgi:hypothetical protein
MPKAFPPPAHWTHRGSMTRAVLTMLRQASDLMTAPDIALEMLASRGRDEAQDRSVLRVKRATRAKGAGVEVRYPNARRHAIQLALPLATGVSAPMLGYRARSMSITTPGT